MKKLSKILSESYPFKENPLIREEDDFRNHDYDPSWDYDIDDNPDPLIANITKETVERIKEKLLPEIEELKDIEFHFIKDAEDNTFEIYSLCNTRSETRG